MLPADMSQGGDVSWGFPLGWCNQGQCRRTLLRALVFRVLVILRTVWWCAAAPYRSPWPVSGRRTPACTRPPPAGSTCHKTAQSTGWQVLRIGNDNVTIHGLFKYLSLYRLQNSPIKTKNCRTDFCVAKFGTLKTELDVAQAQIRELENQLENHGIDIR